MPIIFCHFFIRLMFLSYRLQNYHIFYWSPRKTSRKMLELNGKTGIRSLFVWFGGYVFMLLPFVCGCIGRRMPCLLPFSVLSIRTFTRAHAPCYLYTRSPALIRAQYARIYIIMCPLPSPPFPTWIFMFYNIFHNQPFSDLFSFSWKIIPRIFWS